MAVVAVLTIRDENKGVGEQRTKLLIITTAKRMVTSGQCNRGTHRSMPRKPGESYKFPGDLGNLNSPLADDRSWQQSGKHHRTTEHMSQKKQLTCHEPC